MPDIRLPLQRPAPNATERLFPTLTSAQVTRMSTHGRRRTIARDEVLVEPGDKAVPFFVVVDGEIQILRPSGTTNADRHTRRPGIFAVGHVRGGNIKRVASAVGEGSIAVAFVHQVLHL